jgi:hypothetical protein
VKESRVLKKGGRERNRGREGGREGGRQDVAVSCGERVRADAEEQVLRVPRN